MTAPATNANGSRFGGRLVALRRAAHLVRRAGRLLVGFTAIIALSSSVIVAAELLMIRSIVERFDQGRNAVASLVALAALAAGRRLLTTIGQEARRYATEKVERSVLAEVLDVAGSSTLADFETPAFQDALSRSIRAGKDDVWGAAWGLFNIVTSLGTIVALVIILATTAPSLLVPFAFAAVGLGIVAVIKSRMSYQFEYADTEAERERQYLRHALVSRTEGREMRLFGTGGKLRTRHHQLFDERLRQLRSVIAKRTMIEAIASIGLGLVLGLCLVLIGTSVANDGLALSNAAVAAVSAHRLASSQSQLFSGLSSVLESTRHVADLDTFLERPLRTPPAQAPTRAKQITLEDVAFRYPGATRNALDGVSLTLPKGKLIAVVGENGSGKTTLGRMMLGLYQPTAGNALLIDEDDTSVPIEEPLVGVASAAFQDYARYELPVVDNIALGSSVETDGERARQLVRDVNLDDRINQLSHGIETRLGRKFGQGQDLSIGQWQRLALARAAYNRDADFVVLDEPSASLDPHMEAVLFDQLRTAFPHQGILLISHRLASLHTADLIVVMHDGVIAEQGTHRDLLEAGGIYAALYRKQIERLDASTTPPTP